MSSLQLVGAVLSLVVVDVIVLMKWSQSFLLSLCSVLAKASIYASKLLLSVALRFRHTWNGGGGDFLSFAKNGFLRNY